MSVNYFSKTLLIDILLLSFQKKFSYKNSKKMSLANLLTSSLISGYLGYIATKNIKKYLE